MVSCFDYNPLLQYLTEIHVFSLSLTNLGTQLEKWLVAESHCTQEDFPKLLAELLDHPLGICLQGSSSDENKEQRPTKTSDPVAYILKVFALPCF